jgi:transposase
MTLIHLSARERKQLQSLLARGPGARGSTRAQALLWLAAGESVARVADLLGVSRRTVYYWIQRFQESDHAEQDLACRLDDAPRSGRPRTVSGIIDPLIAEVIDRAPRDLGYPATGWTNALLRRHLKEVHGLTVSRRSVSRALARLRIRWKRPRHQLALRPETWRQSKGGSSVDSEAVYALSC